MKTIADIRARRAILVDTAAAQRAELAAGYASLSGPANVVGAGLAAGEWLRRHPLVVGAAATVAVLLRPRRMLRLAGRGLVLWRTLRSVQTFLRQLRVAP